VSVQGQTWSEFRVYGLREGRVAMLCLRMLVVKIKDEDLKP
jgi:hypothetical protein